MINLNKYLFILTLFLFTVNSYSQFQKVDLYTDNNPVDSVFELLDKSISNKKHVLMTDETMTHIWQTAYFASLCRYLNTQHNFTRIANTKSKIFNELLNQYITTDDTVLDAFFNKQVLSVSYTNTYNKYTKNYAYMNNGTYNNSKLLEYNFYRAIKLHNKGVKPESKLQFISVGDMPPEADEILFKLCFLYSKRTGKEAENTVIFSETMNSIYEFLVYDAKNFSGNENKREKGIQNEFSTYYYSGSSNYDYSNSRTLSSVEFLKKFIDSNRNDVKLLLGDQFKEFYSALDQAIGKRSYPYRFTGYFSYIEELEKKFKKLDSLFFSKEKTIFNFTIGQISKFDRSFQKRKYYNVTLQKYLKDRNLSDSFFRMALVDGNATEFSNYYFGDKTRWLYHYLESSGYDFYNREATNDEIKKKILKATNVKEVKDIRSIKNSLYLFEKDTFFVADSIVDAAIVGNRILVMDTFWSFHPLYKQTLSNIRTKSGIKKNRLYSDNLEYYDESICLSFGMNYFTKLNSSFNTSFKNFNSLSQRDITMAKVGLQWVSWDELFWTANYSFGINNGKYLGNIDSLRYKWSNHNFTLQLGGNLTPDRMIKIVPSVVVGYNWQSVKSKLEIESNLFYKNRTEKVGFKNNGFFYGPSLIAQFNLRRWILELNSGYTFETGKGGWQNLDGGSQRFGDEGLKGLYLGLSLGLMFDAE